MKVLAKATIPSEAGFFIGIPHPKGTPEHDNCVDMLKEIASQNHDEYQIEACDVCESCGAINRTVDLVSGDEGEKMICEFCSK